MATEKKFPNSSRHRERRSGALTLLINQLNAGYKPRKVKRDGIGEEPYLPLTDNDRNRIQSQIEILKGRI